MWLQNSFRTHKRIVLICFALLAVLHLAVVLVNHYHFRTYAYYYGMYNFAFCDFAHFQSSPIPLLIDASHSTFLQDHFSFLLPLLSPLYWLLNGITGTYTLLVLQWLFIIFGGWTTYKLIALKTTEEFTGLMAMLCYFLLYSRFCSYQSDCNLAIFGSALIPPFLYYFETKKILRLSVVAFVLLITREDFSLWLIFISAYLMVAHRKNKTQLNLSVLFLIISLLSFVLIFKVLIPAFETDNKKFDLFNYGALGKTPYESLVFILSHPIKALQLLFVNHLGDPQFDWIKTRYYLVFGISGGFLLFFRPNYLLVFIPIVAKKMYNDDPIRWSYETYYGVETASVLPVLIFLVLSEFKAGKMRMVLSVFLFAITIGTTVYCFKVSNYPPPYSKFEFYKSDFFKGDYSSENVHALLRLIPNDAAVSASGRILPHLASRQKIYYFPNLEDAEYACFSLTGDTWPLRREDFDALVKKMILSGEWKALSAAGSVMLFQKVQHR